MKKLALLTASILASGAVVASPIYDFDEVQGGGTNVSGTNIRDALTSSGLVQTLDNDAEVHMENGGGNDVVIIQGELGGAEHNRAFVDIESEGWSNDVRIRQHIVENDAIVQVGKEDSSDESFNNVVDINQSANVAGTSAGNGVNRAWVSLDDAGNSIVNIDQDYNNRAAVVIDGNSSLATGNTVDVNQLGKAHNTNVGIFGDSDRNDVYVKHMDGHGKSQADISIKNSSNNRGSNNWGGYAQDGIHVVQSTGDYAGVFVTNSNSNAVFIYQN
ncbi:hypothetical protein JCM19240_1940 [Vibrio maritimus]|uniref:Uncharacterized protein n=1 Tax=Vibrio maritimus TaxID=990268 RepID=A0A090T3C4_9VIBR|nr:hypothetical protein JCM19240_1940 [Vibrio maritimus]